MTIITNFARVTIHRIRVTDAHSVAGEPGDHAEWNAIFQVNGFNKYWRQDVPLSAGSISIGADYDLNFDYVVPLLNGKVTIRVWGDEIDDWPNPDDKLTPMQRVHTPATEFPLGAGWLRADVSDLGGGSGGFFPYEKETETLGGYTIWYSIYPHAVDGSKDKREYIPLFRTGLAQYGWYVHDWEGFTKNHDKWVDKEGLRLRRVATHLSDVSRPAFAETGNRTFMGIYTAGSGRWEFWLMDIQNFTNKYNELRKMSIRCDDIFCYREGDTVMLGGTFSSDGEPTELVVLPEEKFVRDREARKGQRQRLVSIDTYHDGKERCFVGLYDKGEYEQEFIPSMKWNDFAFKNVDQNNKQNLRVVDYCLHNEGGELRISPIWSAPYTPQDWVMREEGFYNLESRINFNINMGRQIHNLDSWSPEDPE